MHIVASAKKKINIKGRKRQSFALKCILFWSNYSLRNLCIMTLLPNSPRLHCILFTHFSCSNFILHLMLKSLLSIIRVASKFYFDNQVSNWKSMWGIDRFCDSKIRTYCVHKLLFVFVLIFRTIYVHNMFWACSFHVQNS